MPFLTQNHSIVAWDTPWMPKWGLLEWCTLQMRTKLETESVCLATTRGFYILPQTCLDNIQRSIQGKRLNTVTQVWSPIIQSFLTTQLKDLVQIQTRLSQWVQSLFHLWRPNQCRWTLAIKSFSLPGTQFWSVITQWTWVRHRPLITTTCHRA